MIDKRAVKLEMLKNLRKLMQRKMMEGMGNKNDKLTEEMDSGSENDEEKENEIEISLEPNQESEDFNLKEELAKYFKGKPSEKKPLKTKIIVASSSMGMLPSVKKAMGKPFAKA